MRIAQVNDVAFVGSTLARALRDAGVDAELVEPWRPGAGIPYPWKAVTAPLRAWGLLAAAAHLRRGRFDVVHVHYARLGMLGPLAGRPYVLHCHGSDIRDVTPDSPWGLEVAPFLRGAAQVLYATPDLAPWVTAFRPDASFQPNPIDLPPLPPDEESTPPYDLLVGVRLDRVKGLDAIESTVAELVRRRPATTITIVDHGAGVSRVGLAAGPAARVIRPVPHAAMPGLFREHRLVLGQFLVGAIGNYELEALAAGVPVVAHFSHGGAYATPPPIVEAADGPEAALRVATLLEAEPGRRVLSAASRDWIAAHHAAPVVAEQLLERYRSLLED